MGAPRPTPRQSECDAARARERADGRGGDAVAVFRACERVGSARFRVSTARAVVRRAHRLHENESESI